ncbi:hypothetical protein EV174_002366 [Coemansia sp. RSA 2320]|nr:hypothetical protein EV174_002366 [Coemansia sp. RSA 2320]
MLTISMDVLFGVTLSPPGKFKFKSFETASLANLKLESSTHFTVYTIMSRESTKRPLCDTWSFKVEDEDECATWVSLLRCAIRPNIGDGETGALVILNPVSGKRKAQKMFDSIVKPIFDIGSTPYTLLVTDSPTHATEFVEHEDLSRYSCVVAVGGDGILHDILNGFLRRSDWPKYKALPLGVIPAGSGNGLAKSLDCMWPEQAAVAIVKAQSRPLDILSATLASGRIEYCFLSMTWGLIADIDIESERMRWAGPARFDFYGTIRLMNLRYYGGRLHYLPAFDQEPGGDEDAAECEHLAAGNDVEPCDITSCSVTNLANRTNQGIDDPWGLPPPSFSSPLARHATPKHLPKRSSLSPNIQPAVTLRPTLTAGIQLPITQTSLPPRWKTVEGPFVQVIAANVPWLSSDFLACQRARISDGTVDLVYSGAVSKWQILPYISSSARDNYMNKDGVEHVKVRAFILEPTGLRTTGRSETLKDIAVDNREASLPADNAATLNGSAEPAELVGSLRPPEQVAFSLRSHTDAASIVMGGVAVATPAGLPLGDECTRSPVTHTAIPALPCVAEAVDESCGPGPSEGCRLVGSHGIVDLDGEVAELGPIKVECLANLVNIICPPWLNECQSARVSTMPQMKAPELIVGSLSREGSVLSFNV